MLIIGGLKIDLNKKGLRLLYAREGL